MARCGCNGREGYRGSIVSIVKIGASSMSVLNKGHTACSAVCAAMLMMLLLLGSLLLELAIYLVMDLQTLALFVLVVLSTDNIYVVMSR